MNKTRKLAYLSLGINVLIWGAALPIVKPALSHVSPYQYLFYRYLLAVPLSIPILIVLFKRFKPSVKSVMTIFGMELIGVTVALSFLYEGLRRTTAIEAQLIANSSPVFIIIGGVLLLKERLERHELVGLLVAVAGILILTLEPVVTAGTKIEQVSLTGNLLVLGYPLMWATYLLLAKKVYKDVSKLLIGFLSLWVGLLSYFFLMWFTTPHLIKMDVIFDGLSTPTVFFASLYMGLLGSIVAVPAYIYGNDKIEASEASLFSYLQPLIAIPLAVVWLGEKLNLIIIIALILITLGVILAERRRGN